MEESRSETELKYNNEAASKSGLNTGTVHEPLVSVIVPAYNTEAYLRYCIESIRTQSYQKLEMILIDDGSTDGSPRICDEYGIKDSRVRVIHKENGGLSAARNTGLDVMKGEWVTFVDSDDYLHREMIEIMIGTALKDKSDMVHVLHKKTKLELPFDYDDDQKGKPGKTVESQTLNKEEYKLGILSGKLAMYSHGKLYKAGLFRNIRFPEGKLYEDVPTTWAVSKIIDRASVVERRLYFYRMRSGSIVNEDFKPSRMDQVYAAEAIYEEVKDDPILSYIAGSRCFFSHADNYSMVCPEFSEEKAYLEKGLKRFRGDVLKDKRAKKSLKLMAVMAYVNLGLVRAAGKMYKARSS